MQLISYLNIKCVLADKMSVKPERNECHVRARLIRKWSHEYHLAYSGISDFNTYTLMQSQGAMKRECFILIIKESECSKTLGSLWGQALFYVWIISKIPFASNVQLILKTLKILQLCNTSWFLNFSIWQVFYFVLET